MCWMIHKHAQFLYSTPCKGTAGFIIQIINFILFQSVTNELLHSQFAKQMYALHHQVDVTSELLYTRGGSCMRRVITKQLMYGSAYTWAASWVDITKNTRPKLTITCHWTCLWAPFYILVLYVHKALKIVIIIKQAQVNMEWMGGDFGVIHTCIYIYIYIYILYTGYIMLTCTGSADCQHSSKCDCYHYYSNKNNSSCRIIKIEYHILIHCYLCRDGRVQCMFSSNVVESMCYSCLCVL